MLRIEVSEIHVYPLRPKGFEGPLFPTAASGREIMEHLLEAPWLSWVSELRVRAGGAPFFSVASLYQRSRAEWDSLENLIKGGFLDDLTDCEGDRTRLLGEVENTPEKGFSFLVEDARDLREVLVGVRMPGAKVVSASGAFLRAGRRGRRAG